MSSKRKRLKQQWSCIDAAFQAVELYQLSIKQNYFLDSILKSNYDMFDKLLYDDPVLVDYPLPVGYNHSNIYQIIIEKSTDTFIDNVFTKYFDIIFNSTEGGKILVPVACERG